MSEDSAHRKTVDLHGLMNTAQSKAAQKSATSATTTAVSTTRQIRGARQLQELGLTAPGVHHGPTGFVHQPSVLTDVTSAITVSVSMTRVSRVVRLQAHRFLRLSRSPNFNSVVHARGGPEENVNTMQDGQGAQGDRGGTDLPGVMD
ncbi:MAG: hypothetical protein GY696_33695 [Gammaproteobacteria bacterium]|nr:hypothetical protein [Gammaproteobacteria bacterium]